MVVQKINFIYYNNYISINKHEAQYSLSPLDSDIIYIQIICRDTNSLIAFFMVKARKLWLLPASEIRKTGFSTISCVFEKHAKLFIIHKKNLMFDNKLSESNEAMVTCWHLKILQKLTQVHLFSLPTG